MDNKKDIEYKENNKESFPATAKDVNSIDFFSKDEGFVFVYKKTEKLATALYMITNLFSDSEPMKWTLRTKASDLLSFIISFKDILESSEKEFSHNVKTKVLEIISLLEVGLRSGLVSSMNFSILKSEFINMVNFLSDLKKSSMHHMDLKENFFEVPKSSHYSASQENTINQDDIRHNNVLDVHKRTNRQNIIMNFLVRRKKEVTIHDIAEIIRDCSEKTIQRELISLINVGLVKKVGERRWSKYSLV